MKRFFAIVFLVAMIMLTASSCGTIEQISSGAPFPEVISAFREDLFGSREQKLTKVPPLVFEPSSYEPVVHQYAYEQLETEDMRTAYRSLEESIYYISDDPGRENGAYQIRRTFVPDLNTLELFKVKEAVIADHPEAFWINGRYSIGYDRREGDYIILYSTVSGAEAISKALALVSAVDTVIKGIPSDLPEYERELYIHDIIIKNCEYDNAAVNNPQKYTDSYSAYGVLVNNLAVCGGYSTATKLLLERVGIECRTVTGTSMSQGHMWNIVKIGGEWYQLDVTWNDPSSKDNDMPVTYWYFNLTDQLMQKDHTYGAQFSQITNEMIESGEAPALFNFDLPGCSSLNENFFTREAMQVNNFKYATQKKINTYLADTVNAGKDLLFFEIDDTLKYSDAVEWLSSGDSSAFNQAANLVNSKGLGEKIKGHKVYSFMRDGPPVIWEDIIILKIVYEN